MALNFVPLYLHTHHEAIQNREIDLWEQSFRENVACARAIERTLREEYDDANPLPDDCAKRVLDEYGFKRVNFVLANTVLELEDVPVVRQMFDDETLNWAKSFGIVPDNVSNRYYCVDTATVLLNGFIQQTREAFQALGLFERSMCSAGMYDENVKGKVLVMKPSTLKEQYWTIGNQLWLAESGFGCDPKSSGRAIYAVCLSDGEHCRWNREDFVGVLDEKYLPEWAKQKLEEIQTPEQDTTPSLGNMELR